MYKIFLNSKGTSSTVLIKMLLIGIFITIPSVVTAQNQPLTMVNEGTSIERVFDQIESQLGLRFVYDTDFKTSEIITVPTGKTTLGKVMNAVLRNTNRKYRIIESSILIERPQPKTVVRNVTQSEVSSPLKVKIETSDFTGTVVSSHDMKGLARVMVRLEGPKTYVTETSANGKFKFDSIPLGDYAINVSHLDFSVVSLPLTISKEHINSYVITLNQIEPKREQIVLTPKLLDRTIPIESLALSADPGMRFTPPRWAIKTNLLHDATASVNLGVEIKVAKMWTLDIPFTYNNWTSSKDKKFKNFIAQPEMRRWIKEPFNGHFIGVHAHLAYYNVGGIKIPFALLDKLEESRYEGNLFGVGISYGYQWMLSNRLSMEATFGLGYAYVNYEETECRNCGYWKSEGTSHYFGPTKLGLSLIYIFR